MLLSIAIPAIAVSTADFTDLPDSSHFTYAGIVSAINNGIMQGVGGGKFNPDAVITRAEAAIYLVNVMGATTRASLSNVTDIPIDAWYAKDGRLAIAVQMGVIVPVGGLLRPGDLVTREEAFDMMAKAVRLSAERWNLSKFTDSNEVSNQYGRAIQALVDNGYIQGIPSADGKFRLAPKGTMTRGEFAALFGNVFQGFVNKSGTTTAVSNGNVVVKAAGATLKDLTVKGDLIIGDGVGNGTVTLDNVTVEGRLVIRGGGRNSINIKNNSKVSEIIVSRVDGAVRVTVVGNSSVEVIYINNGKDNVIIEGDVGSVRVDADVPVTLTGGTVGTVTINAPNADVSLAADSTVTALRVQAPDVSIDTERGSQIGNLTVTSGGAGAAVTGAGAITTAQINANDVAIESKPQTTTTGVGVTGTTVAGSAVSGGSTQAGSGNQGGNSQGGNSQGGNSQGGNSQGGNQGGNSQGGNNQGGNSQGGGTTPSGIVIEGVHVWTDFYPTPGATRPTNPTAFFNSNPNHFYEHIDTVVNNDNTNYTTPVAKVTGIAWERLDGSTLAADGKFTDKLYKAVITVTANSGYRFGAYTTVDGARESWGSASHTSCGPNCGHGSLSTGRTIVNDTTMTFEIEFGPTINHAYVISNNQVKIWLSGAVPGLTAADFEASVWRKTGGNSWDHEQGTITNVIGSGSEYTLTFDPALNAGDGIGVNPSESAVESEKMLRWSGAGATYVPELAGLNFNTADFKLEGFNNTTMAIRLGNWHAISNDIKQTDSLKTLAIPGINNGEPFNLFQHWGGNTLGVAMIISNVNNVLVVDEEKRVWIPIPSLAWCENWACANFAANKWCTQAAEGIRGDTHCWNCLTCAAGYNAADHAKAACPFHFKCDIGAHEAYTCGDHWKCWNYQDSNIGVGYCDALADCGVHYKCRWSSRVENGNLCSTKGDCDVHFKCEENYGNDGMHATVCSICSKKSCDADYNDYWHDWSGECLPFCAESSCFSPFLCDSCSNGKCETHCGGTH